MTPETSIYEFAKQGLFISPDKTAIWFYGNNLTYRELFRKIDNVADHLYGLGVRQGTVVTIHLPNCPQAVMAVYAVAKLGGICNMLHPLTPLNGLRENMAFTESEILITGGHFQECSQVDFVKKLLYVDISAHMGFIQKVGYRMKSRTRIPSNAICFERLEKPCKWKAMIPEQSALAECCAAYLNSSGTTGEPKTVMHCHRAMNQEVINAKGGFHLGHVPHVVLLEIVPLFHGMGLVIDLHIALSSGAKIVQMATWDLKTAVKLINKQKVTMMSAVPRVYYSLLEHGGFSGENFEKFFSGGEQMDPERKARFGDKFQNQIYEAYGMTELVASCCGEDPLGEGGGMTPFPNCHFAAIDSLGNISKYGEGEFIISSNTIMMGYFKDEVSTKAVLTDWNGRTWVKTGDFGLIDDNGRIHYKDRIKNIILFNGYNVYPNEVEQVLMCSPLVKEVCVFGVWNDHTKTQNVVAAVVPQENHSSDIQFDLMQLCEKQLPHYAKPKAIHLCESLAKNEMGKIDRTKVKIAYEKTK